jgi:DNA replication protein DnaC
LTKYLPVYQKAFSHLEQCGRKSYGKFFNLFEEDIPIIGRLIAWSTGDQDTARQKGIDLEKGILLSGSGGCDKTSLMSLMKYFLSDKKHHVVKPCRDIAFEFHKSGFDVIPRYAGNSWLPGKPIGFVCFDDLGTEQELKYYGQDCNVMAEIILSRYERFARNRCMTHFTTNLSADEIEERYGHRVRSRLREMCNLIAFPASTPDKRK